MKTLFIWWDQLVSFFQALSPKFYLGAIDAEIKRVEPSGELSDLKVLFRDAELTRAYYVCGFSASEAVEDAQLRIRRARQGQDPEVKNKLDWAWDAIAQFERENEEFSRV